MTEESMIHEIFPRGKLTLTFEATEEGLKTDIKFVSVNDAMILHVLESIKRPEFQKNVLNVFFDKINK